MIQKLWLGLEESTCTVVMDKVWLLSQRQSTWHLTARAGEIILMFQTDCFMTDWKVIINIWSHYTYISHKYLYTCFNSINISTSYLPSLVFLSTICSVLHLGQRRRGSVALSSSFPRTIMINKITKGLERMQIDFGKAWGGYGFHQKFVYTVRARFLTILELLQMKAK